MSLPLRVLYNSVCPVCREGICHFEHRTRQNTIAVQYIDVSTDPAQFEDLGISLDDVRFKLHAISANGAVLKGWPAIAELWKVTPGFHTLAQIGNLPGIRLLSAAAYDVTARFLWAINRAQKRW